MAELTESQQQALLHLDEATAKSIAVSVSTSCVTRAAVEAVAHGALAKPAYVGLLLVAGPSILLQTGNLAEAGYKTFSVCSSSSALRAAQQTGKAVTASWSNESDRSQPELFAAHKAASCGMLLAVPVPLPVGAQPLWQPASAQSSESEELLGLLLLGWRGDCPLANSRVTTGVLGPLLVHHASQAVQDLMTIIAPFSPASCHCLGSQPRRRVHTPQLGSMSLADAQTHETASADAHRAAEQLQPPALTSPGLAQPLVETHDNLQPTGLHVPQLQRGSFACSSSVKPLPARLSGPDSPTDDGLSAAGAAPGAGHASFADFGACYLGVMKAGGPAGSGVSSAAAQDTLLGFRAVKLEDRFKYWQAVQSFQADAITIAMIIVVYLATGVRAPYRFFQHHAAAYTCVTLPFAVLLGVMQTQGHWYQRHRELCIGLLLLYIQLVHAHWLIPAMHAALPVNDLPMLVQLSRTAVPAWLCLQCFVLPIRLRTLVPMQVLAVAVAATGLPLVCPSGSLGASPGACMCMTLVSLVLGGLAAPLLPVYALERRARQRFLASAAM